MRQQDDIRPQFEQRDRGKRGRRPQKVLEWWTLAAVSFGLFMIMLDNTVVNVTLGSIQSDIGADLSHTVEAREDRRGRNVSRVRSPLPHFLAHFAG